MLDAHRIVVYAIFTAIVVAGTTVSASSLAIAPAEPVEVVVGYVPDASVPKLLTLSGAKLVRDDPLLGFVVLSTPDPNGVILTLTGDADVRYAEVNRLVRAHGASADGSRWDGSRWDGSAWDGSRWDGSAWDGSRWDGSDWDGSRWDGADWDGLYWDGAGADGSRWDGHAADGSAGAFAGRDSGYPLQWGLGAVNAPTAWSHTVGSGSRVLCVLDSGVDYTHPDLAPNMWTSPAGHYGRNVVDDTKDPMDDAGHGTHVAGIAAAATGNGLGIAGLAQAKIMAVKVLKADGTGTEADVASGLTWCAAHRADVALMSLSGDVDASVIRDAVRFAERRGVVMVASVGNDGCDCTRYPAGYEQVIAVGASDRTGARAGFSNTGPHVDLLAPGHRIVSTFLGESYVVGSGTSQAAPFVAGAAVLVWDAAPGLTAAEVRALILAHAGPGGVVDAGAAVAAAASL